MVAIPPELTNSRSVCFGRFVLDPAAGELRKSGILLKLQPQPFRLLLLLAEHPGTVVTREEIKRCLWNESTFVDFEHGINFSINQIRVALADNSEKPRYIQTVPRRGYRFIGSLDKPIGSSPAELGLPRSPGPTTSQPRHRALVLTTIGMILVGGTVIGLDFEGWRSRLLLKFFPPAIHSLAVLPLSNLSNDPDQEYFSDGMTDALITDLAQIGSLRVISRTSSMRYKQTKKSLPEIARELNVDGIIEGTVQRSGNRVRITAQLIYGPSDKHIWANSYERDTRDVFALERDVTRDIAQRIQARISSNKQAGTKQPLPMDPKALEAYLQGNYHLDKQGSGFGDDEMRKAAEYFQQAIDADPNFAPAYRGLSLAHRNRLVESSDDVAIGRKAAEKSVEVDPNYTAGRVNLAVMKWMPGLDWRGAEDDLRQAVALDPNVATAHSALCSLLIALGHLEEGLQECRIAERVDPFDEDSAVGLYLGRDYDGSIALMRMMLQKNPNDGFAHCAIFPDYMMKGMHQESINELGECFSLLGQPEMSVHLRHAFQNSGYNGAIHQWIREIEHLHASHQAFLPGNLAQAYAILGDKDHAFYWLGQAYEHREMLGVDQCLFYLSAEPLYDPLRSDPRFKELLHRVGLP